MTPKLLYTATSILFMCLSLSTISAQVVIDSVYKCPTEYQEYLRPYLNNYITNKSHWIVNEHLDSFTREQMMLLVPEEVTDLNKHAVCDETSLKNEKYKSAYYQSEHFIFVYLSIGSIEELDDGTVLIDLVGDTFKIYSKKDKKYVFAYIN